MSIPASDNGRRAFTLLEVMIATVIIGLLSFSVYRFVSSNLQAMQFTTELQDERESLQAVVRFLQTQLADLPRHESGALLGNPLKLHDASSDELIWKTYAGQGVLTTAAPGAYRVTMTVQPVDRDSTELELGLRREIATSGTTVSDPEFFSRGAGAVKYNWVPLLRPMAAFEVRYFDPRVNAWLDRWTDQNARPQLLRVRLWREAGSQPLEAVLPVPSAAMQQP